jgi:arsenite/tail-anchored protein-transporting ATPase
MARLIFLAGKGGVGKTTCSASLALRLAREGPVTVISVDPAHSLRDVFAHEPPPPNLTVETIDTRAKWKRFRESVGAQIENAIDALTPRGMSLSHDTEAIKKLIEIAPPGADELFAIIHLSKLIAAGKDVVVDTAPTGHFLRLLDLPAVAGEWVREFMRLLLKYRELIPAGSLGEELVNASRALKSVDEALHGHAEVLVVTRPERIVVAETRRLIENLQSRGIRVSGVIANYVTPENDCPCDRSMRSHELAALEGLAVTLTIERRDAPVTRLEELAGLPVSSRA